MKWTPEIKKRSETVKRIIKQHFLTQAKKGKKKLSAKQEQTVRKQLRDALDYLDRNAIELGDGSLEVLKLLGPPYGQQPENSWLYPGEERNRFYALSFIADKVAEKYFTLIYDLEGGR